MDSKELNKRINEIMSTFTARHFNWSREKAEKIARKEFSRNK